MVIALPGWLYHFDPIACCHAGQQETAVILKLLVQSLQPMLASLQAWLYAGLLDSSAQDFFICEGQNWPLQLHMPCDAQAENTFLHSSLQCLFYQ